MIERSNEQKERERGYKTKITLMTVILMIFTTLSLVFGLSLSSLQSQSYFPFSIPSTPLGSVSVFASSQEPEFPLRYNEDVGNPVFNLPGFTSEVVAEGLVLPTTMAFLSQNDILGTWRRTKEL